MTNDIAPITPTLLARLDEQIELYRYRQQVTQRHIRSLLEREARTSVVLMHLQHLADEMAHERTYTLARAAIEAYRPADGPMADVIVGRVAARIIAAPSSDSTFAAAMERTMTSDLTTVAEMIGAAL